MEPTEAWSRLEGSAQWARLTPPQRVWVLMFVVSSGDAQLATRVAYKPSTESNLRAMGHETAHHPKVLAALDLALGTEPTMTRAELVRECQRKLRTAKGVAADHILSQLERLTGVKPAAPVAEPEEPEADLDLVEVSVAPKPEFRVGMVVTQKDASGITHRGRIVAVDDAGKPTSIETIS